VSFLNILETTFGRLEYVVKHNVSLFQETAMHTTGLPNGNVRAWGVGMWHLIVIWGMIVAITLPSLAQRLTWLGTLGGDRSEATGVSADGSVVVGWAYKSAGQQRAFRWTAAGGMQDLGTLGTKDNLQSEAWGVSADGNVVVGWAESDTTLRRAFRWSAGRMRNLGVMVPLNKPSVISWARGVSANGSVVVGLTHSSSGDTLVNVRAFRWMGRMQDIGTLGGGRSDAYGVSADGSVVVGRAQNAAGQWRAFRWTGGMQDLGTLPGYDYSEAYAVSADGSVIVGGAYNEGEGLRAFRWTVVGGMQDLGTLGGSFSEAWGVSADGSIVVGRAQDSVK
jgi:probable HAF family extracellular repeat protein